MKDKKTKLQIKLEIIEPLISLYFYLKNNLRYTVSKYLIFIKYI